MTTTRTTKKAADLAARNHAREELLEALAEFEEADHDEATGLRIDHFAERYSDRNAMLIVMQCSEATDVRGYGAWQAAGRQVRKGEHGIRILAPAGQSTKDDEKDERKVRKFFRLVSVFDIDQTDPK